MPDRTYFEQTDPIRSDKTGRVVELTTLRRVQIKLDNALNEQPFRVPGDFLYADSDSNGRALIKLNNTSEDPMPFIAQAMVEGLPIKNCFVSCAAQPGLVLNLWFGYQARFRPPQNAIATIGSILTPVNLTKPSTIDTVADVALGAAATTQVLPADAARQSALISNLAANVDIIRLGDANTGAARGIELQPGQTATLNGTEAIHAFSPSAQSVGVAIIKD
jgi:hypothetical protein